MVRFDLERGLRVVNGIKRFCDCLNLEVPRGC